MTAEAAAFARDVIAAAAPGGRERAKNLLWAAGKLAGYGIGPGLSPVARRTLRQMRAAGLVCLAPAPG